MTVLHVSSSAGDPEHVACIEGEPDARPSFAHVAITSPLGAADIIERGQLEGWITRQCNRGPFELVKLWIENRLLFEVLDPAMLADYRRGMTMATWARMFGIDLDTAPKETGL